MIPGAVRVTTRPDVDRGRPPTTRALFVDALTVVARTAQRGDDITAFVDLAKVMPTVDLQALIDSQPPTTQWVERCVASERRRAIKSKTADSLDMACAVALAVLRGERWIAS